MTDTASTDLVEVYNPATGEVLNLKDATTTALADAVKTTADLVSDLGRFKQYLVDEVAHRLDSANARSEVIGDWVLETNAPTSEEYPLDILRSELEALVEAGDLDAVVLERVIVQPPLPTEPPPPRVDKREVNKLKKSDNRKVLAALGRARKVVNNSRTLKLKRKAAKDA